MVNDPQSGLAQSLNGLNGYYEKASNQILLNALRFSEKENLKKALSAPVSLAALKTLCQAELEDHPSAFFAVTDKDGKIDFDNLGIPKPTPSPVLPNGSKKIKPRPKPKSPLLASAKDWPGMGQSLSGSKVGGLFPFQGSTYLLWMVPVQNRQKTIGTVAIGSKLDGDFLKFLKNGAVNDVALYSKAQTLTSTSKPAPSLNYEGRMVPLEGEEALPQNHPVSIEWNRESYLVNGVPLLDVDQKPAAYLAVFQPVKETRVIEGNPQRSITVAFLTVHFIVLLLVGAFIWFYGSGLGRLKTSLAQMAKGDFNVPVPANNWSEWGRLGGLLKEMTESLKEKDRISLVLGKVVDPQAARKILAEKDYFSLKGERRECTLLQADLKGFNTLSENMPPEALVEALNQYFSIINELVFKYEGMMDKFIGETAVAVWGAPFTHDDKEIRAVKAALEIQSALKDFNISRIKKGHPPFTVGIGVHTGTVVSGNLGSNKCCDYSIIGEPLHVVARLCAMAAPGQTVLSEETYEKIKPSVKATPLNPIAVKGSLEPLKTYDITQLT